MADQNGNVIEGLAVKPLADDQINQPGANTEDTGSSTASSPSGTATGTATPSATSSKSAAAGVRPAQGGPMPFMMVLAIAASFLVGLMV